MRALHLFPFNPQSVIGALEFVGRVYRNRTDRRVFRAHLPQDFYADSPGALRLFLYRSCQIR